MSSRVTLEIKDNIAFLEFNRPDKRNALDMDMFQALDKSVNRLRRDRTIRGVLLSGQGPDFCSGLDVQAIMGSPSHALRLLWKWLPGSPNLAQRITVNLRRLNVPVFCAIQGRCWGGGLQIALGADFRIASPDASLSIMEGRWGLIPDMGGTLALREFLPVDKAMYLSMSAAVLTAQDALNANLLTEIHDDPRQRALALMEQLSQRSPDSIAAVKKLYHTAWHGNDRAILARETWYQLRILLGRNQRIATRWQRKRDEQNQKPAYVARQRW